MNLSKIKEYFILVDGSSYLYRAFYALPDLKNSSGQSTGAIYGVINMIFNLLKNYNPKHLVIVFDAKGKNFRHDIYPKYKIQRPVMPCELQVQIEPLHRLIKALGIPLISINNVESDDVIGTLSKKIYEEDDIHILISTSDKDLAQLVNERTFLIDTMKNKVLDVAGVKEKFGVFPEQMIDFLSIIGDKSDNIPGLYKVGPKTASKWLEKYDSVDNLIEHSDEITGKVGDTLRSGIDQLHLSRKLIKLKTDIDLDFSLDSLCRKSFNTKELYRLLNQLEFKKLLSEVYVKDTNNVAQNPNDISYKIIQKEEDFDFINELRKGKCYAINVEYFNTKSETCVLGISFCTENEKLFYVPISHKTDNTSVQLDKHTIFQKLKKVFEDKNNIKIMQNLKLHTKILDQYNVEVRGQKFDVLIESYVINSSNDNNISKLTSEYLGYDVINFEDVLKKTSFSDIDMHDVARYSTENVKAVFNLHKIFWEIINHDPKLHDIFTKIDAPLVDVILDLEKNGVCVDKKLLENQSLEFEKKIKELESIVFASTGEEFNLSSPKQLQSVLHDKLGIPVIRKTSKGQPSTSERVLKQLSFKYPLVKLILEHRKFSKLKSTYTDALPKQIDSKGRVHTSYSQIGTITGRLTSFKPNLQNIPVRTKEGKKIRQAFVCPLNKKIVSADYSQIELRIMAHLSQDENLIEAFSKGADIHKLTASEIFNVSLDKVSNEQRRKAKAINFGLIYGMSAYGLANQVNISNGSKGIYRYF